MKIFVKAKPRAGKEFVEKVDEKNFIVGVKEAPVQGKANKAILKALAKYFKVSPSQVLFISGVSSKHKIFEVK